MSSICCFSTLQKRYRQIEETTHRLDCGRLRKKQFHEELKTFLIELGEKEGYKSYSGDSECLDVPLKRKRIEYKPDIVWNTGKSCYAFEFAFTEDWRAVIGEFALAWLKGCSRFFVFRLVQSEEEQDSQYDLFNNLFGILGKEFKKIRWFFWVLTKEHERDIEKTKKEIRKELKKWNFIG